MGRVIVSVAVFVLVALAAFFFWVGGGFDLFKSPIEIVIPSGYSGAVCAKLLPSSAPVPMNRYEVSPTGLLPIDADVVRSHRRWRFLSKTLNDGSVIRLPDNVMFPIFTETDMRTDTVFGVYWIGTADGWNKYRATRSSTPVCIGRF